MYAVFTTSAYAYTRVMARVHLVLCDSYVDSVCLRLRLRVQSVCIAKVKADIYVTHVTWSRGRYKLRQQIA